jgi:hypothetical protein
LSCGQFGVCHNRTQPRTQCVLWTGVIIGPRGRG